ncbi:MAG TPA: anthrone oxygenase family protein [Actinophytocola sp.]|jgi:uncharacterized membrane protein|uniref:anthrone oxygenase family protein n=1 Tax=Actinophytocola sp. TaxID=1872138 RepID=UPI002F93452F
MTQSTSFPAGVGGPPSGGPRKGGTGRLAGFVLAAAAATVGLMAGTFFAFAVSVMPALATVDDEKFVEVMNKINVSIENNQAFLLTFTGAFVFSGAAAIMHHRMGARAAARWIIAGLALYVVALAVTMGFNIPLNQQLAKAGLPGGTADLAAARADFEGPWDAYNVVRTIACTLALVCLGRAVSLRRAR